jgi:ubiquinone/menaquinone biosynthesis C-methylase UbiE
MHEPIEDLNARYLQQAKWTGSIRRYLLERASLSPNARVLEVGCGTGAVLSGLDEDGASTSPTGNAYTQFHLIGLDLDGSALQMAHRLITRTELAQGDARMLPFAPNSFDLAYCHFLLLWVPQPDRALAEMVRVTRPGGWVMAFAEPDYGGRVDYPPPLDELGRMQSIALASRGADPQMGRKLSGLFHATGLREVVAGMLGGQWQGVPSQATLEDEWRTLASDLEGMIALQRLELLRQINETAWREGRRVLFVPTFYAAGRVA